MFDSIRSKVVMLFVAAGLLLAPALSVAATKAELDREVKAALADLCEKTPAAKMVAEKAKAVLVFPSIVKGGLIIGGAYGDGGLVKNGEVVEYYNSVAASYGLQAGVQKFGYAMFFMTDKALEYLHKSGGWEVGVGPSIVIVDKETAAAFGKSMTSTTLKEDIYAFIFSQKGLMAGIGLQGSKITKINPK
ncbi:lipid-binding SYLF domain-containing protein [Geomonas sp. RF6]|uniref:lipid-binding SYLF domain-containing protein n=1 Tax=Geomonas sp. RF6 TaxID=2897342 RepID=UPI001E405341|nr:lipid-binding SYLF domain-containing protein [Geomonas sp. RF6]UFS69608.1 lipid-binding SYLF domain-containing protein [Geomonas sp. RF6]